MLYTLSFFSIRAPCTLLVFMIAEVAATYVAFVVFQCLLSGFRTAATFFTMHLRTVLFELPRPAGIAMRRLLPHCLCGRLLCYRLVGRTHASALSSLSSLASSSLCWPIAASSGIFICSFRNTSRVIAIKTVSA